MSRIGKKPIVIPQGVEVNIGDDIITVKGPKGVLTEKRHPLVDVKKDDSQILISVKNPENKNEKALWGLYGSLINNMIKGVVEEFEKKLEVNGVGYKVLLSGKKLVLNVGYSHPVDFAIPEGIAAEVEKNVITIKGANKQLVGEIAAQIRSVRKPEPYKGKGIKYIDEIIRRKAGKTAAKGSE